MCVCVSGGGRGGSAPACELMSLLESIHWLGDAALCLQMIMQGFWHGCVLPPSRCFAACACIGVSFRKHVLTNSASGC